MDSSVLDDLRNPKIDLTEFNQKDKEDIITSLKNLNEGERASYMQDQEFRNRIYDLLIATGSLESDGATWNDEGGCGVEGKFVSAEGEVSMKLEVRGLPKPEPVVLGKGGYGITISVTMEKVDKSKPVAVKIGTNVGGSAQKEAKLLKHLTTKVLDANGTPHLIRSYFAFSCKKGPPRAGFWEKVVYEYFTRVPSLDDSDSLEEALGLAPESGDIYYIGLEMGFQDLGAFASGGVSIDMSLALNFQLMQAVAVLHQAGIMHRDLQMGNVVVTQRPEGAKERLYVQDGIYFEPMHLQFEPPRWVPYDLKLIDFGLSTSVKKPENLNRKRIASALGLEKYRAPEFFFVETATKNNRWGRDKKMKFTPESEVFSTGLLLIAVAWKEPMYKVENGGVSIAFGMPPNQMFIDVRKQQEDLEEILLRGRATDKQRRAGLFTYYGGETAITLYLWGLVHLLGFPKETDWRGITEDPVYKLLKKYSGDMDSSLTDHGGWISSNKAVIYFGLSGQAMLKKMLAWNPDNRPSLKSLLQTSGYFDPFVPRGFVAKYIDKIEPTWGPKPTGFQPAPAIACRKRTKKTLLPIPVATDSHEAFFQ